MEAPTAQHPTGVQSLSLSERFVVPSGKNGPCCDHLMLCHMAFVHASRDSLTGDLCRPKRSTDWQASGAVEAWHYAALLGMLGNVICTRASCASNRHAV